MADATDTSTIRTAATELLALLCVRYPRGLQTRRRAPQAASDWDLRQAHGGPGRCSGRPQPGNEVLHQAPGLSAVSRPAWCYV